MKTNCKERSLPGIRILAMAGFLVFTASPSCAQTLPGRPAAGEQAIEKPSSGPSLHTIESSNYDAGFSPGESTTTPTTELDEIYAPKHGYLDSSRFNRPLDFLADSLSGLYEKTGLRLGFASTSLFMQPLGGQSSRSGTGGDLDFMSSWTLVGRGTKDTGRLVVTGEYRYTTGDQPPSALGGQMGTLIAPVGTFNGRGWVLRDAYWIQRLFDARLRILIGRGAPDDYVGSYWLQSVNNSFANRHFSANPGIPFPGHGPMLGVSFVPNDRLYITGGISNGNSLTTEIGLDSMFDDWASFTFGEVGYTPNFEGLGAGRYAVGLWRMDARSDLDLPADSGLTFIADQNLTENLQVFARYSYSDGTLTNVRQLGQVGLGFNGLLGREDDLTGFAVSLGVPRSDASRNETVLEAFHRFQVSRHQQLSMGLQLIANPGNTTTVDTAGAFYIRLRTTF